MSSAIALALVAILGVPEASAQKGKERRKHTPLKVSLVAENLTTHKKGTDITASAGDEVTITLTVTNYTGSAQSAVVDVVGGVPGNMIHETVVEFFEGAQTKSNTVSGIVPANQSGILTVNVLVSMPKTDDSIAVDGSVAFNVVQKDQAPANSRFFERAFTKLMVRSLLDLHDGVTDAPTDANMTEVKELYR